MNARPVSVLVVDDSAVVRMGIRTLLSLDPEIEIVGEAADGDAAVEATVRLVPDVVLLDVRMPLRDGLSALPDISAISKVVMLTFTEESARIHQALRDGAVGYLVHGTFDADSLSAMVRAAAAGSGAFSGPALAALRAGPTPGPTYGPEDLATHGLSARQVEVMNLISSGLSNQEIARQLFLAEKTVKNHINQIFAALGVTSRPQAIVLWRDRSGHSASGPRA